MSDDLSNDVNLTDDPIDEEEKDIVGEDIMDIPLALDDNGEPIEADDSDEALIEEGFSAEAEGFDEEDPDAYLYEKPAVTFKDSAEEELSDDWLKEE